MKTGNYKHLNPEQQAQLDAIERIPDSGIDLSEMPEKTDWTKARRGLFRPVKQQLTVRLDMDIVQWFRQTATGENGYQTRMNAALREYMLTHEHSAPCSTATSQSSTR